MLGVEVRPGRIFRNIQERENDWLGKTLKNTFITFEITTKPATSFYSMIQIFKIRSYCRSYYSMY